MYQSENCRPAKSNLRGLLALSLFTLILLSFVLSATGCGNGLIPAETTVTVNVSTTDGITVVTTIPPVTSTVLTDPVTTPAPVTTTAPITTIPTTTPAPVTTTKPETTLPTPSTRDNEDYLIDMTDYWDVIDPTGDLWDDAYLMLVNADHPIEKNQEDQYDALKNRIKFSESDDYKYRHKPDILLNATAMKALSAMFNEAAADGIEYLDVTSAHRSYSYQKGLFDKNCDKTYHWLCSTENCGADWIGKSKTCPLCGERASETLPITREEKEENVATYSCAPGTSDHQTGLAVDIIQRSLPDRFDSLIQEFGETEAGKWLAENCYRFGFILRFPPDKQEQTGIIYEPWHFRYVGRTHATAMHDMNLCLEEYVEYLESTGYFD